MQHILQDPNSVTPGDLYHHGRYTVIKLLNKGGQGLVVLVKDNTDQVE
jgi:hypothetical protein